MGVGEGKRKEKQTLMTSPCDVADTETLGNGCSEQDFHMGVWLLLEWNHKEEDVGNRVEMVENLR